MIEKIIEKLKVLEEYCLSMYDWHGQTIAIEARNIVQEVAKEYTGKLIINSADMTKIEEIARAVKHMKVMPIQTDGGWIPCSERLPEGIVKDCLVTLENGAVFQAQYAKYCKEFRIVAPYHGIIRFHEDNPVIAWMELPAPYQNGE